MKIASILSRDAVRKKPWSLVVGGDCSPLDVFGNVLQSEHPEQMLDERIAQIVASATYTLVNLETPICSRSTPIQKTGPSFRAQPGIVKGFKKIGIDCVALANNHIMDQGVSGLKETIQTLEQYEISHHGANISGVEASKPLRRELGGHRVTFISVAEGEFARSMSGGPGAAPLDMQQNRVAIQTAAQESDIVVISVHAGNEFQLFPSPRIQRMYREFIDAGARVVVGHHPHVVQGIEQYKEGLIIYSLGNFLFDYEPMYGMLRRIKRLFKNKIIEAARGMSKIGVMIDIHFDENGLVSSYDIYPFRNFCNKNILLLNENAKKQFLDKYCTLVSTPLLDEKRLTALWEDEVRSLFSEYEQLLRACSRGIASVRLEQRTRAANTLHNLFWCDSHRDVIETMLRLLTEDRTEKDNDARHVIEMARATLMSFNS